MPVATGTDWLNDDPGRIEVSSHDENPKHATKLTQRFLKKKLACTFK